MLKQIISQAEDKMEKSIEAVKGELATIRTGRASASLVEHIMVDCYGSPAPLNQVAGISVPEAQLIIIQPWDKNCLGDIEKAVLKSNIGITPTNDVTLRTAVTDPTSGEVWSYIYPHTVNGLVSNNDDAAYNVFVGMSIRRKSDGKIWDYDPLQTTIQAHATLETYWWIYPSWYYWG